MLAAETGLSESLFKKIHTGTRQPTSETLVAILLSTPVGCDALREMARGLGMVVIGAADLARLRAGEGAAGPCACLVRGEGLTAAIARVHVSVRRLAEEAKRAGLGAVIDEMVNDARPAVAQGSGRR